DVKVQQSYIQTKDGSLEATWEFIIDLYSNHFHGHVTADGKRILSLTDWVARASYAAVPFGESNPLSRGRVLLTDPEIKEASPHGWHNIGDGVEMPVTNGNNVQAYYYTEDINNELVHYPMSQDFNFAFPLDINQDPSLYKAAAATNAFVWFNYLHDRFYKYGFKEAAGNFQINNWGKGGKGGDAVVIFVQSPKFVGRSFFKTLPDGEVSYAVVSIYDFLHPRRDGNFDSSILTHEYGHGVSNRLVGGPHKVHCLRGTIESGGISEGTSDFFAIWEEMKESDTFATKKTMGEYVKGAPMRAHPYAVNNGLHYGHMNGVANSMHAAGNIWGTILYDLYWSMVAVRGFTNVKHQPDLAKGNTLTLQLIMDALKLMPCHPTLIDARNAIVQAMTQLMHNQVAQLSLVCRVWGVFTRRGLGLNARSVNGSFVPDATLPPLCADYMENLSKIVKQAYENKA
ncbi:peptidase M36, partial [Thamnocephalis sphaerospora]